MNDLLKPRKQKAYSSCHGSGQRLKAAPLFHGDALGSRRLGLALLGLCLGLEVAADAPGDPHERGCVYMIVDVHIKTSICMLHMCISWYICICLCMGAYVYNVQIHYRTLYRYICGHFGSS